jgi:hypothetical protein
MATAHEMIVQTEYGFTRRAIPLSLDLGMTETDDGHRYLFDTHTHQPRTGPILSYVLLSTDRTSERPLYHNPSIPTHVSRYK